MDNRGRRKMRNVTYSLLRLVSLDHHDHVPFRWHKLQLQNSVNCTIIT